MNIVILGAAGFIGTNLAMRLATDKNNQITLVDSNKLFFPHLIKEDLKNVIIREIDYRSNTDYLKLLSNQEIVYHLISTTVPVTSNRHVSNELTDNIDITTLILEACVKCKVQKIVFLSSGGTVYGKEINCPLKEDAPTNPINSYGIQKIVIEKLLYLYNYLHGLDYRVIRLSNPYGPYQRPNGILGVVTNFIYKALKDENLTVYGDGTVIRDFIYIDDAVEAIIKIANGNCDYRIFNVGCGYGTSINGVLRIIRQEVKEDLRIVYEAGRNVDVPINYLDISRYEAIYGKLGVISLNEGIKRTVDFMKEYYKI